MTAVNRPAQPVGELLGDWTVPPHPARQQLPGRFARLEPLRPELHAASLYAANSRDAEGRNWTYLPYGPFDRLDAYLAWMESYCAGHDPMFYAIVEQNSGLALGVASYLRITPASGCIEVGHIHFSPPLQRTPAASEAVILLMKHAFELGYRRFEWKCDALNAPSRTAAQRLGFSFEGIFRQAAVVKGRNRDTAWFAVIDRDWPALAAVFARWLDPDNFDPAGQQRLALSSLTAQIRSRQGEAGG